MKRIIAIVMSALMAASVFTACGSSKTAESEAKSGAPSTAAPAGKKVTLDVVTSYGGDDGNRKA